VTIISGPFDTSSRSGSPGDVDPRILERREAVITDRRNRWLGNIAMVALIAGLVGAAIAVSQSSLLDVDTVAVRGAQQVTASDIQAASGIVIGDALVDVDLGEAGAAIATIPWVATVEVSHYMSGEVVISITERTPAAVLVTSDANILVDADGRVLSAGPNLEASLVQNVMAIGGVEIVTKPGRWVDDATLDLVRASVALPPEIAGATWALDATPEGLELYLGSSVGRVILGDVRELEAKVWAIRAFAAEVNLRCLDALDVRAPSVPVLTFRPDCS